MGESIPDHLAQEDRVTISRWWRITITATALCVGALFAVASMHSDSRQASTSIAQQ
jgi:hypothetical protein